jgi:Rrf2 family protein
MQLSTVGRYALRAMVDLAIHRDQQPVQRADIAARQEISAPYLAHLLLKLKRADLVKTIRGPGGGYLLARDPEQITAGDVLRAVEETLSPVFCVADALEGQQKVCHRADGCPTHWLWGQLGDAIHQVLDSTTLTELSEHAVPSSNLPDTVADTLPDCAENKEQL